MNSKGPRIYLFDKDEGVSTFDLIRQHKKSISAKKEKIGHFGTLDPFATGLVLIGLGGATRLNEYVHEYLPKTYYAKGVVGPQTNTGDKLGEIVQQKVLELNSTVLELETKLKKQFLGEYLQRPHSYSATKHQGKELYKWAKEGIQIEKPPVKRFIYSLEILSCGSGEIEFKCTCSSGTYIRVLFEDMMSYLFDGPWGHLKELRRLSYGHIDIDNPKVYRGQDYQELSLPEVLPLTSYLLSDERVKAFRNGLSTNEQQVIQVVKGSIKAPSLGWIRDNNEEVIGLAELNGRELRPRIVFPSIY